MAVYPQWIKRVREASGVDHLGFQAASISTYGILLPGITNQTHRARYFSFYPWVLQNYVRRVGDKSRKKWRDFLRRSEFLYALIGSLSGEETFIVGTKKAKILLAEKPREILLRQYADYDAAPQKRYWKGAYGGYAQYYLGALKNLDIIQSDENDELEYFGNNGQSLADAIQQRIGPKIATSFFDMVQKGCASMASLTKFSETLPPSKLTPNSQEATLLRKILLESQNTDDLNRVDSIKFLLNIISQGSPERPYTTEPIRQIIYTKKFPAGNKLDVSKRLERISNMWHAYTIAEYLHFSLESIFWGFLYKAFEKGPRRVEAVIEATVDGLLGRLLSSKYCSNADIKGLSFQEFLTSVASTKADQCGVPELYDEVKRHISNEAVNEAISGALVLYANIVSSHRTSPALSLTYGLATELGRRFPDVNPQILLDEASIAKLPVRDALASLIRRRIINRHIKIAMEKMSSQRQSTFRFITRDGNLLWLKDISPTLTTPRIEATLNLLTDLGMIHWQTGRITALGASYL